MRLTAIPNSLQFTDRPSDSARHPIRRRLWKFGIAAAAALAVFISFDISARMHDPSPKLAMGHDLLPSYAAGVVVSEGRPRAMYDREALSAVERKIIRDADLEIDGRFGPWLNPPFFAWAFVPLATLPYRSAAAVFLVVNIVLVGVALTLLTRLLLARRCTSPAPSPPYSGERAGGAGVRGHSASDLASPPAPHPSPLPRVRGRGNQIDPGRESQGAIYAEVQPSPAGTLERKHDPREDWRTLALVPLLTLIPLPFWQAMGHQQNTFISFTLLLTAVTLWRQARPFAAGAVAGLLFFKPQLAAVFALVLVFAIGWRALAGLALTGSILLLITLLTLPGCLPDYLHRLPPMLHWLQMESPFNWGRQVTFQSFWRLLLQGHVRGDTVLLAKVAWWIGSAAFAVLLFTAISRYRHGSRDPISRDRLIAASIASMPVLMPYYMDYDLLLLAIPAVLLACEWVHHPRRITRADFLLLAMWISFGLESHFNPGLAGHSRLNLAVPLLATIAFLHLCRCLRPEPRP